MPRRLSNKRIVSEAVQGDDSWVEMRSPKMGDLQDYREQVENLQYQLTQAEDEEKRHIIQEQIERIGYQFFARYITAWNWVDDNGNPLPQPHNNVDVFKDLTQQEFQFLTDTLTGLGQTQKKAKRIKQ